MTSCACGCGEDAGVYACNAPGGKKGEPKKFIYTHHTRKPIKDWPARKCECGCGGFTPPARQTDALKKHEKGKPIRFIPGHQWAAAPKGDAHHNWKGGRTTANGYVMILRRGHPRATVRGYVYEHVLVAEQALGKQLPGGAVIHHVNGDPTDNRSENLVICQGQGYHMGIHKRTNRRGGR